MKMTMAIGAVVAALAAEAVELRVNGPEYTVANGCYEATFNADKGGSLMKLKVGKVVKHVVGAFSFEFDAQPETYCKRAHGGVVAVSQYELKEKAKVEVVKNAADGVVLRFSWGLNGSGEASQTLSFDDTAVVRISQDVSWTRRAGYAQYWLQSSQADQPNGRFFPEARDFPKVYNNGARSMVPRWKHFTDGSGLGFGLVAAEGCAWDHFMFGNRNKTSQWNEHASVSLASEYLANVQPPAKRTFDFLLVLSVDPGVAHAAANAELKSAPAVQLCDIMTDKVCVKMNEKNGYKTTIVNNTPDARTVRAVTKIRWGLGEERVVKDETVALNPMESHPYAAEWQYDKDVEWGVTAELAIYDEKGAFLDRRAEASSVSDDVLAPVNFGIVNVGMCHQDGAEAAWAETFRRTMAGAYEYYCWTPATWDPSRKAGMSPEADDWETMTESSGAYRQHLTKKFLKGLIDESHKRGVKALAWITGLCNYRMAYAYPEKFQYCKNGQLAIYNGKVWDGVRYAVAKLAPYDCETATDWGEQMADSCDMFGWDGCRWDWGFMPCSPNDPLYIPMMLTNPEKLEWFDYEGRSCYDKYPKAQEQEVAAKAMEAWDAAVRKRYPKFANCSNLNGSKEVMENKSTYMPRLAKVSALGLLEYLLNLTVNYPTYAIWAKHVCEDTQGLRKYGSQTSVGHMSQLCEGSVGEQLARYTCLAAGSKWWGGPSECSYWGAKRRSVPFSVRFAEYFFSTDLVLMDASRRECEVKVEAEDGRKVFYQQFVFEREKGGAREVVVHVVNTDPDAYITPRQDDPKPVALSAGAAARDGEKLESAHALLPGDEPVAVRLEVANGVAKLPRMEEAASFVFRFTK